MHCDITFNQYLKNMNKIPRVYSQRISLDSQLTPFIEKECLSEVALIKQSKRWHALSALVLHPLQHLLQTINVDVTFPGCEQTEQCQLEQFHVRSK